MQETSRHASAAPTSSFVAHSRAERQERLAIPWREICELLEAIEGEQTLQGFFQRTLERLEVLVPYDYGLAVLSDAAQPDRLPIVISRSAPRELIDRCFRQNNPLCPVVSTGVGDRLRSSPPRHSVFGTGASISVGNLKEADSHGFVISLHREYERAFSALERKILEALSPHLHNFVRVLTGSLGQHQRRLLSVAASAGLSRREKEIYLLLCNRLTIAEIAQRLFISRHTAAKHIEHIYDKLLVSGRRGACQPADHGEGA